MTSEEAHELCQDFTSEEYQQFRDGLLTHFCHEIGQLETSRRDKVVSRQDVEYIGKCTECLPDTTTFFKLT